MKRLLAFMIVSATALAVPAPGYDVVIAGGRVVDGTGAPARAADIAIDGDRIVKIGNLAKAKARRRIDAKGLVVAPGFIDMLGQSEISLLVDPRAMSKVMMGVTTEITGEGDSVSPMSERTARENADYYAKYHVKVDWTRLAEYFHRFDKRGMGLNLATFVGAAQVRAYVVGYDNRPPTADELDRMKRLVARDMEDGALGVSTSLQYTPGRFASTDEIVELAKVARAYGGIYATHQRSEANAIDESLGEVLDIARRAAIPVEIWHLKTAYKPNWGKMPAVLRQIAAARRQGLDITADVYPYLAGQTGLNATLPPWALEGGQEKTVERLKDPAIRARLKKELAVDAKDWENIYLGSGGPAGVQIAETVNPALAKYQGKRLSEVAKAEGKDPLDALFDFLIADKAQTSAIYFMMSEEDLKAALKAPFVTICTDTEAHATDGPLSDAKAHPRGWGAYPKMLAHYVRDAKWLSLEDAIHRMTGASAARVGLKDRGTLKEGSFADVVVFDAAKVKDRATFENPNQYPVGIPYVLINGELAVDKGVRTGALSGRVLRGPGYKAAGNVNPG